MKLLVMMFGMLLSCNAVACMSKEDKEIASRVKAQKEKEEIAAIVKTMIDSSESNAIAHVGNRTALGNIKKHVDDLTWPAQQIQRAQSIEYLKQDIVHNQRYMQESLIKIKKNALTAKPYLLSKDRGSDIIDAVTLRLENAITTCDNDEVQKITHEFLHLLHNDGYQLELIVHNQKMKEDEQKALEQKKHDLIKNAYQKSVREVASIAQQKIKLSTAKKTEAKKEQEAKNKKEQMALQQAAIAQEYAMQQQQKKEAILKKEIESVNPLQELNDIIDHVEIILRSPASYDILKNGLAYVEKAVKKPLFKHCVLQVRTINEEICNMHVLHKDLKKIEKKDAKNKAVKVQQLIRELETGISGIIVYFGVLAHEQKALLMPAIASESAVAASSMPASSASFSNNENDVIVTHQELQSLLQQINMLKKQQMNMSAINDIRLFVRNVLTTSPCFQDAHQIEAIEDLIEPAEMIYKVVCTIVEQGESTPDNRMKVDNCLKIMAANYSHILRAIEQSVNEKLSCLK